MIWLPPYIDFHLDVAFHVAPHLSTGEQQYQPGFHFFYIPITNLSLLRDQFLHFISYHPLNLIAGFDEVISVLVTHL